MFLLSSRPGCAYLAAEGFEHLLAQELAPLPYQRYGRLFVTAQKPGHEVYWYDNCWEELQLIEFSSISNAAKALKSLQRNWWPYHWQHFRRAALIHHALPHISAADVVFGTDFSRAALGSWTLLSEHQILASAHCSSSRPNGRWQFVEDKIGPPSRAYVKLWEVFSRCGKFPRPGEVCLDLGASPGGWTWVLRNLGAEVYAIDRSPLRDDLMADGKVHFITGDAFRLAPAQLTQLKGAQWLFCDVICYPEKLYEFIITSVLPSALISAVCTIKFQGSTSQRDIVEKFAALPRSKVMHLSVNKHELTWLYGF